MAKPRSMLAHTLNPIKGWPAPNAVDFRAKVSAEVEYVLFSGRAVHLNAAGEFITGCHDSGMTLFFFPNSDDPDVVNDGGDPEFDVDAWVGVTPSGVAMALPAAGAYELETTEYDTGGSYPPNTLLTADNDDVVQTLGGVLKVGMKWTDPICGVVSRGLKPSGYLRGKSALAFWPVWLPTNP
jgi:hypothetical protein